MTIEAWLAYAAIIFIFSISPGPAVLLSVGQGMARGFKAGMAVAMGVQAGNLIYFILSVAGLGAILAASDTAFTIVKYVGATYLIYLGVKTIRQAGSAEENKAAQPIALWQRPFVQGLINQLANPKTILFFTAFLPQFIDYQRGNLLEQLLILTITSSLIEVPVLAFYIGVAVRGGKLLEAGRFARAREWLLGSALIGVGVTMTLIKR